MGPGGSAEVRDVDDEVARENLGSSGAVEGGVVPVPEIIGLLPC